VPFLYRVRAESEVPQLVYGIKALSHSLCLCGGRIIFFHSNVTPDQNKLSLTQLEQEAVSGNIHCCFQLSFPDEKKTGNWIKRDQLDVTCFIISLFNAQHVSDVNTSTLRSLRLICLSYFMGCIALVRIVLVLRCGLAGVVWYPYTGFNLHPDTTRPQPNHTVTPTHIEPEQYNPWNNSTNKSQAPEYGCINFRYMLSIK